MFDVITLTCSLLVLFILFRDVYLESEGDRPVCSLGLSRLTLIGLVILELVELTVKLL